jgi:tetratricopeptide (TPR) repeat protein
MHSRHRLFPFLGLLILLSGETMISQVPPDPLSAQRALILSGSLDSAQTSLQSYLKEHPTSADAHFLLGYVLFRREKPKESLAEFTEGAKVRRPTADELMTVASDYVLLNDFSDADKWFSEVTVETPYNAKAWYLLGRTKYNEQRFDEAISCFERSLSLRPRYVEAENNKGLALRGLDKLDLAKGAFQNAVDWQGNAPTDAQPFLNLGSLLADQGELDKAISLLTKAVELSRENPKTHEQLASAYLKQGDLEKAQHEMEIATALSPETSALHFKLGQIYKRQKLVDLAQREFAICEKLNSTHSSSETPNPFIPKPSAPK